MVAVGSPVLLDLLEVTEARRAKRFYESLDDDGKGYYLFSYFFIPLVYFCLIYLRFKLRVDRDDQGMLHILQQTFLPLKRPTHIPFDVSFVFSISISLSSFFMTTVMPNLNVLQNRQKSRSL